MASPESMPPTRRQPPAALPAVGDIVMERYRVERYVGSGGMAHVLAARHTTLGNEVAIKVLDPTLADDLEAKERFAREARAMASLSSKHTVRVFDVGALTSGLPFLVMELLIGHDLGRELSERGPLPLSEACEYIDQAAQAVAEAHAAGIIHRDLKPQNLFLTKVKGQPVIRVLDFGIARTVGAVKLETITRHGDVIGTLHYMAPEQIRNSTQVEPRSDVWSLGACLYKLITGFPPFPQQGEAPLMSAILASPPTPIGEYRQDVPAVLSSVVMRCLRKPLEERFATMNDLRKAISEARLLMTTDDLQQRTEMLPRLPPAHKETVRSAAEPNANARMPTGPQPQRFEKTMPLDPREAAQMRALLPSGGYPSEPAQPQRVSQPHTPAQPMQPPQQQISQVPQPQISQVPQQQASQVARPSSALSFVMIIVAVAVGVFLAGLGLLFVASHRR